MSPTVKSIPGYFYSVSFIRFYFTERMISEIFNELGIYSSHKKACQRKLTGKRFVIMASMLHNDAGLTFDRFNPFNQRLDVTRGVFDFKGRRNNLAIRAKNSNHALVLGNINTYCVEIHKLVTPKDYCNDRYQFYSLPIPSTVV